MNRPVGGSPGESYVPETRTSAPKASGTNTPESVQASSGKLDPKTMDQLGGAARTFGRLALVVVASPVAVLGFAASVGMRMRETPKNSEAQKFSPMRAVKAEASSVGKDIKLTGGLFQTIGTVIAKPFQSKTSEESRPAAQQKQTVESNAKTDQKFLSKLIQSDPVEAGRVLYDLDKAGENAFKGELQGEIKKLNADQLSKVITGVLSREIEEHRDAGNLLRLDSLGSKLVGEFSKNFLAPIISEQFTPLLENIPKEQQLVSKNADGESQLSKECVGQTKVFVGEYLKAATAIVSNNSPEMNAFKEIVQQVETQGNTKFGNDAGSVAGANLLFLRVLNPILPNPSVKGISVKYEQNQAANALVFSKVVQNMANNVEFGQKEQHMVPFNAVLKDNKESMNELRDSITGRPSLADRIKDIEQKAEAEAKTEKVVVGELLAPNRMITSATPEKLIYLASEKIFEHLENIDDAKSDEKNLALASKWLKATGWDEPIQKQVLQAVEGKLILNRGVEMGDYSQYPKT